jgi:hypothetical protein
MWRPIIVASLIVMAAARGASGQSQAPGTPSSQDLANQANNPAAPLSLIQFRDLFVPHIDGASGVSNGLQVQPVLPIGPFNSFPFVQLVKITFPIIISLPDPVGQQGQGDLQIFDLLTFKQTWGQWGVGPALVFPTASKSALGSGKYEAGPAVAVIYTGVKNLTAGAVVQNPISYAGAPDRDDVNNMLITPTFTFNLSGGWFVGIADYNCIIDWTSGGSVLLPMGVQVGRVVRIGKQPVSMSFEAGGAVMRPADTPKPGWILGFEFSPIFNFHVGPGVKIRGRGGAHAPH